MHQVRAWVNPDGTLFLDGPKVGRRYRVVDVQDRNWRGSVILGLQFPAWPDRWFNSFMFRKVRPRADALEAGTAASIADLRPAASPRETENASASYSDAIGQH